MILQDTHVHDVMDMMIQSGKVYSEEALKDAIRSEFGVTATFCSCSRKRMSVEEAIEFLEGKGKLIHVDGGVTMDESKRCSHGNC